jgi:hypothetical protein
MKPSYADETGEYHFFHTLIGQYPEEHFSLLRQKNGVRNVHWDHLKIKNFLKVPDDRKKMEEHMGLPYREIMCTFSKTRNAVTYHLPFGLILSGEVRASFNNDSGLGLSEKGQYDGTPFSFTSEVTLQQLAAAYKEKYQEAVRSFQWDEVVLKPGSHIVGAFHDPNLSQDRKRQGRYDAPEHEYEDFLNKCRRLGLPILEVEAKWK